MEENVSEQIDETMDSIADQLEDCVFDDVQNGTENHIHNNLSEDASARKSIFDSLYHKPNESQTSSNDQLYHDYNDSLLQKCFPERFDIEEADENDKGISNIAFGSNYEERDETKLQRAKSSKETEAKIRDILVENDIDHPGTNDFRADVRELKVRFQGAGPSESDAYKYREVNQNPTRVTRNTRGEADTFISAINFDETLFDSTLESVDCDMCFVGGKVVNPTSYCYKCHIYMCGTCYKHHRKIPTTCDHCVVHRNDIVKNVYSDEATYTETPTKENKRDKPLIVNRELVDPGRYQTQYVRDNETVCSPCYSEGRQENGSAFCVTCAQYQCIKCKSYHTKFEASKDHEIVHKHTMEAEDFKTFVPALIRQPATIMTPEEDSKADATVRTFGSTSYPKKQTPRDSGTINWKRPKAFSTLIYHDLLTPEITGISYIGERKLLACDRRNKCLKLFSEKLLPLSVIDVPDIADVTSLSDITAVVSQPEMNSILYIGFKENSKMFIRKTVETKGKYWGVEHLNQELFALCMSDTSSQASIHMLNQKGQVLSIIQPHLGQGYDLQLKNSKYFAMSPTGGTFYITDTVLGMVAIGTDGRAIFSVQSPDIERPSGIQADSKNIYVCCPATSTIVRISPDGKYCRDAVSFTKSMVLPNCIALGLNTSQVAVAFLEGETVNLYQPKNQI